MPSLGIPQKDDTVFIMIDIQEKFLPVIYDIQSVIENANRVVKSSSILNIPLIITEQYPKGLGPTIDEIQIEDNQSVIEKITFDCFGCDEFAYALDSLNRKCLIIFGIEAHVCILQTCLRAVEKGYEVYVIADAVSSRTQNNRNIALERMRQSGVFVASTEMILFQLMDRAGTDEFKAISKLVK
jgi:nicotinamidase-related amidase